MEWVEVESVTEITMPDGTKLVETVTSAGRLEELDGKSEWVSEQDAADYEPSREAKPKFRLTKRVLVFGMGGVIGLVMLGGLYLDVHR